MKDQESGRTRNRAHRRAASGTRKGSRTPRRRMAAASHALFHPDYDRRPWHRTRSADLRRGPPERSRAPASFDADTAGGDFHPAL